MTTGKEIEATAKAVEEVAKTAGKAIDAGSDLGGFFSRVFGPALEETGGALHDQVRFWRKKRLLRLEARYRDYCNQLGADKVAKPTDLKFGVPLIEAASLENDDNLQDMYARLLANATTEGTGVEASRAFVTILQDFGPFEAKLLELIYHAPLTKEGTVLTGKLPEGFPSNADEDKVPKPTSEVELALQNLSRLGCIAPTGTWGGGSSVSMVTMTSLGRALYEACSIGASALEQSPQQPEPDTDWGIKFTSEKDARTLEID